MKTNYLLKNKSRRSYSGKVLFLIGVFLVGAVFFYFLGPWLVPLVSPLWKTENAVARTLSKGFDFFRSRQTLIEENITLKEKVASLELERSSFTLSGVERQESIQGENIRAAVLTRPPQSPYDILIIDAGYKNSVIEGGRIFLPEGPELGVVSAVFPTTAKVKLFSTDGEKTSAVLERGNDPVTLEGVGGGNFRIIVPRDTAVEVGDRVLSAHLSSSLLAIVGDVEVSATDSFKEVLAKSPVNIFSVRFVLVRP
ncbi:MAG: hypothetical protein HYT69_00885 [Candidatus Zambryskibacteria bacterium]|nr:hypothetical protein [Candidatus Zambryskibacteria bacterium]